jgi:hypothetical protein
METLISNHKIEFKSSDENGPFNITFCTTGGVQLQIKNSDFEAYVNLDKKELTEVRNIINRIIEGN